MCNCDDCVKCMVLNIINKVLTIVVVLMNGIYAAWGLFIPRSVGRSTWKDYAEKLEVYLDVVSYSDSILIPMKAVSMILVKWCCCKIDKAKKNDDEEDQIDICESPRYKSSPVIHSSRPGGVSTFQLKEV